MSSPDGAIASSSGYRESEAALLHQAVATSWPFSCIGLFTDREIRGMLDAERIDGCVDACMESGEPGMASAFGTSRRIPSSADRTPRPT